MLCSILQAVADTWTDNNGVVWSFSIENGNAVGVKPNDKSSITGDLVIPEYLDSYPVRAIGEDAFYNCSALTSITIPNNVTTIGARAFSYCNHLSSVHITDLSAWCGITFSSYVSNPLYYGHHLFLNGEEITDLVIPSGISLLRNNAFSGGYFSSVTIPSGCLFTNSKCVFAFSHIGSITLNQYLAEETFIQAQIGNLIIASEVTGGGSHAFYDTKIDNLEIPYSSKTLEYSYGSNSYALFDGCTINKATINRRISSSYYGSNKMPPFYGGSIKELHVGSNTWYNGNNLCDRVTIDDLYFDGITDISANAFYSTSNNNIHNIYLSNEISSIGSYAFYSCGVLNNVYAEMTTPPEIDDNTFASRTNATLYVPSGCKDAYAAANYWKDFNIVENVPDGVSIAVNYLGKGTYCCEYPLDFTDVSGIKAYIISGFKPSTGNLILTRAYEIPAGTGLYIDGTPGTTYNIPVKETDFYYSNMMKGVLVNSTIPTYEGGYTNYVLVPYGSDGVIFAGADNASLSANRAYVQVPTSIAGARSWLGIEIDDNTTGIEGVQNPDTEEAEDDYYNLNGQKVQNLKRGIYIRNGKKIIIH